MTVNISIASDDGYIRSSSTSYATAQAGSSLTTFPSGATNRYGQNKIGSTFELYESFLRFPYTVVANSVLVSAYFELVHTNVFGTGIVRQLGARAFAWGTLTTGDWRTSTALDSLDRIGLVVDVQAAANKRMYVGEASLNEALAVSADVQIVLYTDRYNANVQPSGAEYSEIAAIEAAGTSNDPALVWTTIPTHTLIRVSGCQAQLSDGRHVVLEADGGGSGIDVDLRLHDGASFTNIATNLFLTGSRNFGSSNQGMQSVALCVDEEDNIYVISHRANAGNSLNVVGWEKTGDSTWAERGELTAEMPANAGVINNLAAAWMKVGTEGTILVVGGHEYGASAPNVLRETFWAMLNCANILNGTGTLLRASGEPLGTLIAAATNSADFNNPVNETGTGLDIVALDNTRGVVVSFDREANLGDYGPVSVVRYVMNSSGTGFADIDGGDANTIELWATKDATSKIRVLPISATQWAVITIDKDAGFGPVIRIFQNVGTAAAFTLLGSIFLDAENIASLPEAADLAGSSAWDAIYQASANRIWFYYLDVADGRRLMRTSIDLSTYQAVKNEVSPASAIGAAGSTNHAIRVQRGELTASQVLVSIANKTSGNVQSTIYVVDPLNIPPLAPTQVPRVNYDASSAAVFDWTFNDPNVGDTQSAYEVEIDNADTLVNVVDTGKVVSATTERTVTGGTLTNGVNYRWRVRTWDTSDEVGPWSPYDFFTTSAGGAVNITSPAVDNPAGYIFDSVTVTWTVTSTTQDEYKVRLVETATGIVQLDTGWIVSTATSHLISGLKSDVEYRIEVVVRNAADVESNVAIRLITANFNEPEIPQITVTPLSDQGHVLVSVVNPLPQGDRPEVDTNLIQRRKLGAVDWITIASIANSSSYRDYHLASGTIYEYRVVGVAAIGSSESGVIPTSITLQGVWLHLPLDPAGTSLNLRFGKNQRSGTVQSYFAITHFAGREDPVADFAHYTDRSFAVTVDVPFGDDWSQNLTDMQALEAGHQVVVYRDGRGRFAFCILSGLSDTDTDWGTQVSFDVLKVDYNENVT